MNTVLIETLRTHLEMVTTTVAACKLLHGTPESHAALSKAAIHPGTGRIDFTQEGLLMDAGFAGEIHVTRYGETLAQFYVDQYGGLKKVG